MQLEYISLLIIAGFALFVGTALPLKKKTPSTISLSVLAMSIAVWSISDVLFNRQYLVLTSINYFCMAVAATSQFYFSLSYTNRFSWVNNRTRWANRISVFFFILVPMTTQVLYWVEPLRTIFFSGSESPGTEINAFYIFIILAASNLFLVDTFIHKPRIQFYRTGIIMLAAFLPLLSRLSIAFRVSLETDVFLSVLAYSLAVAGFSYEIFNGTEIESHPITRNLAVESMDDGWMVVNPENKVVDLNTSAEELIGLPYNKIYGESINQILSDWDNILNSTKGKKEIDVRRSVKSQKDGRYLNLHISKLTDQNNVNFGHLILWRDITNRKMADDARQRAKDELYILINAISNDASRATNLQEFLDLASYQLVYSFGGQAVAIFLTEKNYDNQPTLTLKSNFGLSPIQLKELNKKRVASALYNWLSQNEDYKPEIMDDFGDSPDVPVSLKKVNFDFEYIALIPLFIRTEHAKELSGCLCLGKNESLPFSPDEIVRLTAISNHIATLIDNDQRRQYATKLLERARLQRDLHDSVSQKLYGLLALTEAAQAGIEAGADISPLDILTRIGETARQAVKEMRLFLHEMQPVELKDGLVSALHHRLSAVEGRASINHNFVADENIRLTKTAETALYQIAQEALNNILRHAKAKNVVIALKQNRTNVILSITDDGCGFDMNKVEKGGHGLNNMHERVKQLKGKFKITSAPDKGTKIMVTIGRKR
ncbi:MAG: PAS domain S-box protein [Chloroflexi bacterium]|nr:PAS domain S-box protein [Chloroflexota bacterium]